jgi:cell division protein FtsW
MVAILLVVLMLTGLGLVMISSVTAPDPSAAGRVPRQAIWLIVSLGIFSVVGWVDYKVLRPWVWVLFGATLLMLMGVFVPGVGGRIKGAYRWLNLGGFKLQPSEFLRITLVLLLAHGLAKHQSKIKDWKWGYLWPLGVLAMPLILLKLEPDYGTMLLIIATTLILMFVAGSRLWPLIGTGIVGVLGFSLMVWMMPERRARILAFLNPEAHKDDKFFQIWQGMLAFGSGGTRGLGLGNSRQKMFYIPEAPTDSIFPIIGEELGLYICLAVVIGYMIILFCGMWIAMHSRDSFGMFLGVGMVFGLVLQAMINIATVTGSIPPKGMPLPFVSYGGSNLLISYVAIGFLVSIHRQNLRVQKHSGGMMIEDETSTI